MKRDELWKKHSTWRKWKAKHLRELRNIVKFGFPIESLWNGRRNGNGSRKH